MNWQQIQKRCPSARFIGVALLRDHKLAFTRRSIRRGCGVADAVPRPGQKLWGVVYEIADLDVGELDKFEGYTPGGNKNSYFRRECVVLLNDDAQRPMTVSTYFGDPQPDPPMPNAEYKNLILTGAQQWQLPAEYIRELKGIEVSG
jgi:gamma-glutamylcyclotransferase